MSAAPSEAGDPGKRAIVSIVLDEDHLRKKTRPRQDGTDKPSRGQISRLLSGVYAITMITFGILFPMTEAIRDTWLQSIPNGIFLMYEYVIATAFLLYLQCFLLEPEDHDDEFDDLYSEPEDVNPTSVNTNGKKRNHEGPSSQTFITTNRNQLDQPAMKKRQENGSPGVYNNNELMLRTPHMSKTNSSASLSSMVMPESVRHRHISSESVFSNGLYSEAPDKDTYTISLDLFQSVFEHDGSSFYLRLGTLMFAIGNFIYIGLELEYHLGGHVPEECNPSTFGWTFAFRLIFIIVQSFFIFKNPKVHIVRQKPLVRFGFMHLIATNLCIWLRTLTNEIRHELSHDTVDNSTADGHSLFNASSPTNDDEIIDCSDYRNLLSDVSPYLFPFVMEYSLIATGTIAMMNSELSSHASPDLMANIKHVLRSCGQTVQRYAPSAQRTPFAMAGTPAHAGVLFRKSHRGTFLGFVLMSGMFVSIILFFFSIEADRANLGQTIYLMTDIIIHVFMLIATIYAMFQVTKLSYVSKEFGIDDYLLLISMAGSFFFEMSLMVSCSTYLSNDSSIIHEAEDYIIILSLCSALLAGTQTVLQLILIVAGLRMYSATRENLKEMPGRGTITFLLIGNLTLWVFRTVQVKEIEMGIQEEFYGTLAWLFIMNLNLPLQLFFFFHSSVCLADIWVMAYKPIQPTYHHVRHDHETIAEEAGQQGNINRTFSNDSLSAICERYDEEQDNAVNERF